MKIENVKLFSNHFEIFLVSSKTDQIGTVTTISISAKAEKGNCPLANLIKYLKGRPVGNGRYFVISILNRLLGTSFRLC